MDNGGTRGRGKVNNPLTAIIIIIAIFFGFFGLGSCGPTPTATAINPQVMHNNQLQLSSGQQDSHSQPGSQSQNGNGNGNGNGLLNMNLKTGDQVPAPGQFIYRSGQAGVNPMQSQSQNQNQPQYMASYNPHVNSGYAREVNPSSTPFFGLSSNGEFQLSAYFSQIFWGFVAVIVATAAIIWLIRIFFPKHSIGGIVQKIQESGTGKSLNLDRLTNIVYDALDNYGKWAEKETRDSIVHGKYE